MTLSLIIILIAMFSSLAHWIFASKYFEVAIMTKLILNPKSEDEN